MKVLLTTPSFPPYNSGLGNAVQQQAAALISLGCEVVVATGGDKRDFYLDETSGARVETFAVRGADYILNPLAGDIDGYEVFLRTADFDVVLINAWQTWSSDLALRNLSRIKGVKILYSHGISTNLFLRQQAFRSTLRYIFWRPYWWRVRKYLQQLDGVMFLAEEGCDCRFDDAVLARQLKLAFQVVPNAISAAAAQALERPPLARTERKYLAAVGAYEWQKGHDFVLRAYAQSAAKNKIPLRVYGQRFSEYTGHLRALATQLGISSEYLSFHEGVSGAQLVEVCSGADLLLSGSITECQPLVLLDAMALGTPFIARATGCIPALSGGVAVVTEGDAAAQINLLLANDDHWMALSAAGVSSAKQHYHPAAVGDALLAALKTFVRSDSHEY